ncbi:MAG: glycosyltransferase family 4 protein [Candidatus Accumulibacter phosphatis]|uniref:glycosyltransferase family 4 protein n=1 Tax=Candidatus Accumulibacter sp. ACC012 TaxID=2823332 RepID=UPI0025BF6FE1|nr:glycosyltransferase family 4 protein [Candidatus Accumulibacter sp. ACC012]
MSDSPRKSLRILLSAYACEPGKGSEPGVGWNWALALARRGHDVWVLTRRNNQEAIEPEYEQLEPAIRKRLHFIYYDLPRWTSWWKKGGRGVHLYYALWQRSIVPLARAAHQQHAFDAAHHITFGVWRQPSFLYKLGIPLIFGPVGGGEGAPGYLIRALPLKAQIAEIVRYTVNWISLANPALHRCMKRSQYIVAKTPETAAWITRAGYTSTTSLEIGINTPPPAAHRTGQRPLKCLYAGRLIGWKGIHLAVRAVAKARQRDADVAITLVGRGPMKSSLQVSANALGISEHVTCIDWLTQAELHEQYRNHDLLVFPSLHDSSGNVILEAFSQGLPVLCLNLGGPGVLVDDTSGIALETTGLSVQRLVESMADKLVELVGSRSKLEQLSLGARARALEHTWDAAVENIYVPLELIHSPAINVPEKG